MMFISLGQAIQWSVGLGSAVNAPRAALAVAQSHTQNAQISERPQQSDAREGRTRGPRRLRHGERRLGHEQCLQHSIRETATLEGPNVSIPIEIYTFNTYSNQRLSSTLTYSVHPPLLIAITIHYHWHLYT